MQNLDYSIEEVLNKEIKNFASLDLRGKCIALTGKMPLSRREMTVLLESLGASISQTVSKKTDFLVTDQEYDGTIGTSAKMHKAFERHIPITLAYMVIEKAGILEDKIGGVWGQTDIKSRNSKNMIKAWCKEFPFLISAYPNNIIKEIVCEDPKLFKFIEFTHFTNSFFVKVISMDGSTFHDLPNIKKKNLELVEAAMSAEINPQIKLCKDLLALQIANLDILKFSKQEREYIFNIYQDKKKLEDVLEVAAAKAHFFQDPNSN